jgi:hypothetical protein
VAVAEHAVGIAALDEEPIHLEAIADAGGIHRAI